MSSDEHSENFDPVEFIRSKFSDDNFQELSNSVDDLYSQVNASDQALISLVKDNLDTFVLSREAIDKIYASDKPLFSGAATATLARQHDDTERDLKDLFDPVMGTVRRLEEISAMQKALVSMEYLVGIPAEIQEYIQKKDMENVAYAYKKSKHYKEQEQHSHPKALEMTVQRVQSLISEYRIALVEEMCSVPATNVNILDRIVATLFQLDCDDHPVLTYLYAYEAKAKQELNDIVDAFQARGDVWRRQRMAKEQSDIEWSAKKKHISRLVAKDVTTFVEVSSPKKSGGPSREMLAETISLDSKITLQLAVTECPSPEDLQSFLKDICAIVVEKVGSLHTGFGGYILSGKYNVDGEDTEGLGGAVEAVIQSISQKFTALISKIFTAVFESTPRELWKHSVSYVEKEALRLMKLLSGEGAIELSDVFAHSIHGVREQLMKAMGSSLRKDIIGYGSIPSSSRPQYLQRMISETIEGFQLSIDTDEQVEMFGDVIITIFASYGDLLWSLFEEPPAQTRSIQKSNTHMMLLGLKASSASASSNKQPEPTSPRAPLSPSRRRMEASKSLYYESISEDTVLDLCIELNCVLQDVLPPTCEKLKSSISTTMGPMSVSRVTASVQEIYAHARDMFLQSLSSRAQQKIRELFRANLSPHSVHSFQEMDGVRGYVSLILHEIVRLQSKLCYADAATFSPTLLSILSFRVAVEIHKSVMDIWNTVTLSSAFYYYFDLLQMEVEFLSSVLTKSLSKPAQLMIKDASDMIKDMLQQCVAKGIDDKGASKRRTKLVGQALTYHKLYVEAIQESLSAEAIISEKKKTKK
eukprot:PhF_6_TR25261/c0_g1_i1/m.34801